MKRLTSDHVFCVFLTFVNMSRLSNFKKNWQQVYGQGKETENHMQIATNEQTNLFWIFKVCTFQLLTLDYFLMLCNRVATGNNLFHFALTEYKLSKIKKSLPHSF